MEVEQVKGYLLFSVKHRNCGKDVKGDRRQKDQPSEWVFLDLSNITAAGWWSKQLYYASDHLMNIFGSFSSQVNMGVAKILKIITKRKWEGKNSRTKALFLQWKYKL